MKGWKKSFQANDNNNKKARVAIFTLDKTDFKLKMVKRDKEGHYIMIKWSIHQEDITVVNICMSNNTASKYIKQNLTELKAQTNSNTIIVEDFSTPLSIMDRSSRQRINKEKEDWNNTIDHRYLKDIHRTFHPQQQNTHSSQVHIEHFL